MQNENEMDSNDVKSMTDKLIYFISGTIIFIVLSMTTCTMHSNTFDPERLREEAKIKQVEVEVEKYESETSRQRVEIQKQKLKTIERMVANGVDPIAAGCAILGFDNDDLGCMVAAAKNNPSVIKQEE